MAGDRGLVVSPEAAVLLDEVCHEVGNLMAASRFCGYLLQRETEPARLASLARDLEGVAVQAASLVGQVRCLLRGSEVDPLPVSPADLLDEVERALPEPLRSALRVDLEGAVRLPPVRVDADAVRSLLIALLHHAHRAAGADGRVALAAHSADAGVVFAVEHAGSRALPREPGRDGLRRGAALVLALARQLADRMGGSLELPPSETDSRVWLRLPAAGEEPGAA